MILNGKGRCEGFCFAFCININFIFIRSDTGVQIWTSSEITECEFLPADKLSKINLEIDVTKYESSVSEKKALWKSDKKKTQRLKKVSRVSAVETLQSCFDGCGFGQDLVNDDDEGHIDYPRLIVLDGQVSHGWASYPKNKRFTYDPRCAELLKTLYLLGNTQATKSKRVPPEVALQKCVDEVIKSDWHQRLILTSAKVKAFFAMSVAKMDEIIGAVVADSIGSEQVNEGVDENNDDEGGNSDGEEGENDDEAHRWQSVNIAGVGVACAMWRHLADNATLNKHYYVSSEAST